MTNSSARLDRIEQILDRLAQNQRQIVQAQGEIVQDHGGIVQSLEPATATNHQRLEERSPCPTSSEFYIKCLLKSISLSVCTTDWIYCKCNRSAAGIVGINPKEAAAGEMNSQFAV